MWPVGGIRSYMRYTYGYLPAGSYDITVLAAHGAEDDALNIDVEQIGAKLVFAGEPGKENGPLCQHVFKLLLKESFDLIQSHGFLSACHVAIADIFFKIPHVFTIHGMFEDKFFKSRIESKLKTPLINFLINRVNVIYSVGEEILDHIESRLKISEKIERIVIQNGIDIGKFSGSCSDVESSFRWECGIGREEFVVGFLGRFMPQKGFNFLIEAVEILKQNDPEIDFKVLAVGSGDYQREYQQQVLMKGLGEKFVFIPFQRDVSRVYQSLNLLVMPSSWEAFSLLAAEALCMGVPLAASNCIGLREVTCGTPSLVFKSHDPAALADVIRYAARHDCTPEFKEFRAEARQRYDVRKTSQRLHALFQDILQGQIDR